MHKKYAVSGGGFSGKSFLIQYDGRDEPIRGTPIQRLKM
jgi:hypothetical protein